MTKPATFGSYIKNRRQQQGLTLEQLAHRIRKKNGLPVSSPYLCLVENDRKPPPREPIFSALARALRVSPDSLREVSNGRLQMEAIDAIEELTANLPAISDQHKQSMLIGLRQRLLRELASTRRTKRTLRHLERLVRYLREATDEEFKVKVIINRDGMLEHLHVLRDLR